MTKTSTADFNSRLANLPKPVYPEDLPVVGRREEIARAIRENQVVIVCGETGSGKTTQLPKICLELGRGVAGMIGHTQPRRIAARTVAARIASELNSPLGHAVGYKIRFSDNVSAGTYIKLMTDGILLAETQGDPSLLAYDTLIIDEAHERSLNIDFLLGYLKQLLPKRPELKLIVTSATINAQRFSTHFYDAPVVEVSGRMYPVEVRYRPPFFPLSSAVARREEEAGRNKGRAPDQDQNERDEGDIEQAILDAVDETIRCGPGDVLMFLPGEREIRETAEALRKHAFGGPAMGAHGGAEILPLFARLSVAEQERVFKPGGSSLRRIVLATNVAETSLTVPGIRYVIDTGLARLNRYSYRNKVEQLQVEKISRASANQRAGRCGRVMSGVCIRLYAEEDYLARPEFTDPEILRSSLAAVILRMKSLKIGAVENFPFLDPPLPRMVADGYQLLAELGAVDEANALTSIGWRMARFPIDPKIARMILAAKEENCLSEVLIIASALSVQDPRDRPFERQEAADRAHQRFQDERSDFLGYLKLWEFFDELLKHKKSKRKLIAHCQENFLSHRRMREWREVHGQLHTLVAEFGLRPNEIPATYDEIHRALLAGLLGNIGFKTEEGGEYLGARGIKFSIFPGSVLKKAKPKWVVAAELTETAKLYGRVAAKIDPLWVEKIGGKLCKKHYFDPHWEKSSAQVSAFERVTLYGLTVMPKRRVYYGNINPGEGREIFIRAALVAGEYATQAPFFRHNRDLIADVAALEHKTRRPDVLVGEERIFEFYDALVPQGICSGAAFEKWRRQSERESPCLLYLTREHLMRHGAENVTEARFPDSVAADGTSLPLAYRFEPGHVLDGVTLTVPLPLLNKLDAARFDSLVPGLIREKIAWYLKALPKQIRRHVIPIPDFVTRFLESLESAEMRSSPVSVPYPTPLAQA
ncbi:MAG TPA: ATP-dependent RNA helicase HrpA, partial [Nitrosospira sp.]|nr:ATP-dependent RNA helicase HrpA [Nitrosospira sp.]